MIPIDESTPNGVAVVSMPSFTYKLTNTRVQGNVDDIEAVKQAIYKILMTERYRYPIYDWNYGIELNDLFGKSKQLVYAELERRIADALSVDDRISNVYDFVFSDGEDRTTVCVEFKVTTTIGTANINMEVNVSV